MNKLKVIIATVAIFASGFAVGALVMHARLSGDVAEVRGERPPPKHFSAEMRAEILDRMTEDLGLSEEQRNAIDVIIAKHQEQLSELWDPVREKSDALFDSMREGISSVLTDEQRVKYLEIIEKHHKDKKDHKHRDRSTDADNAQPEDGKAQNQR